MTTYTPSRLPLSFSSRMASASSACIGRDIIRDHELAIETLEHSLHLTPSCGRISSTYYRGFSTLLPAERRDMVKRAEIINPSVSTRLSVLIDDGLKMDKYWKRLLDAETWESLKDLTEKEKDDIKC